MDPSVTPTAAPEAKLIPVFLINLMLDGAPGPIYTDKAQSKALNLARVKTGQITTVKNELGLELEASDITGFDDITNNLAGEYSELDCKLYGKTPEGAGIYITYYGMVKFSDAMLHVVTGNAGTPAFEEGYALSSPRIHLDKDAADKYTWATKENLIGKGRFARDENNNLYVQYYVYVVR